MGSEMVIRERMKVGGGGEIRIFGLDLYVGDLCVLIIVRLSPYNFLC